MLVSKLKEVLLFPCHSCSGHCGEKWQHANWPAVFERYMQWSLRGTGENSTAYTGWESELLKAEEWHCHVHAVRWGASSFPGVVVQKAFRLCGRRRRWDMSDICCKERKGWMNTPSHSLLPWIMYYTTSPICCSARALHLLTLNYDQWSDGEKWENLNEYVQWSTDLPAMFCNLLHFVILVLKFELPNPAALQFINLDEKVELINAYWCITAELSFRLSFHFQGFSDTFQKFMARYWGQGYRKATTRIETRKNCQIFPYQRLFCSYHRTLSCFLSVEKCNDPCLLCAQFRLLDTCGTSLDSEGRSIPDSIDFVLANPSHNVRWVASNQTSKHDCFSLMT